MGTIKLLRIVATTAAILIVCSVSATAETARYTYDATGRLLRVEYDNNRGVAYRYDANGNLIAREPFSGLRRRAVRSGAKAVPAPRSVVAENRPSTP